jgi:hypothetical protein
MSVVLATTWSLKSLCCVGSLPLSVIYSSVPLVHSLFPSASLKATKYASSAMLNATEPCDKGKTVRFDGPTALPHGAVLSCAASHIRSAGHMKATGPISLPSAPSPCVWALLSDDNVVKAILVSNWQRMLRGVKDTGQCMSASEQSSWVARARYECRTCKQSGADRCCHVHPVQDQRLAGPTCIESCVASPSRSNIEAAMSFQSLTIVILNNRQTPSPPTIPSRQ